MDIILRPEAREKQLSRYFTGKPCKHGHISERRTSSGDCIQCNNLASRQWNYANDAFQQQYRIKYRKSNPANILLARAKNRAKREGIEFDITLKDIVIPTHCPVLNIVLEIGEPNAPNAPSLDRIDNTKGYIRGNVCVISWRANHLKNSLTLQQAKQIVAYMEEKLNDQHSV